MDRAHEELTGAAELYGVGNRVAAIHHTLSASSVMVPEGGSPFIEQADPATFGYFVPTCEMPNGSDPARRTDQPALAARAAPP